MATVPMKPVFQLNVGDKIAARFMIDSGRVAHWTYAKECPATFATNPAGSIFEIFELHKTHPVWVKAYFPHSHNTMVLKIAGEELSSMFQLCV